MLSSDGFAIDHAEAGLRCCDEHCNFLGFCRDVEMLSCKGVGMDIHLCPHGSRRTSVLSSWWLKACRHWKETLGAVMMSRMPLLRSKAEARH
jgi:hypothetical protein